MSATSFTSSSTPLSTMKTIQKRFYTALPRVGASSSSRVRSNSGSRSLYTGNSLAFFDTPPSPRPNVLTTTRLAVEARGEVESSQGNFHQPSLPFSLALTAPSHNSTPFSPPLSGQYALFPYTSLASSSHTAPVGKANSNPSKSSRRQRFQLDIGAYGIPKKGRTRYLSSVERQRMIGNARFMHSRASDEDLNLAVQVGEDAYFVRDNAMGVADGVGGWNKVKVPGLPSSSTPSALFARRLMHNCAEEVASMVQAEMPLSALSSSSSTSPRLFQPQPRPNVPNPLLSPPPPSSWYWSDPVPSDGELSMSELQDSLDESLEELEDGLDVLMILERAYQNTLKGHVVPAAAPTPAEKVISSAPPTEPSVSSPLPTLEPGAPLLAGSSTALLAVLDHVPRYSSTSETADNLPATSAYEAVIKIAHIGDCMGMLVRGEEIAWRSEEMWWSFNTPVQLGPSSSSISPLSSAHTLSLPVQEDDILIIASDGLSDNLWDEDILDEVVKFRKSCISDGSSAHTLATEDSSALSTAADRIRWRRALAGMLSEALCSRARRVSECCQSDGCEDDEVPFARRARENGKVFTGGKNDDISVVVAVISPAADLVGP